MLTVMYHIRLVLVPTGRACLKSSMDPREHIVVVYTCLPNQHGNNVTAVVSQSRGHWFISPSRRVQKHRFGLEHWPSLKFVLGNVLGTKRSRSDIKDISQ